MAAKASTTLSVEMAVSLVMPSLEKQRLGNAAKVRLAHPAKPRLASVMQAASPRA